MGKADGKKADGKKADEKKADGKKADEKKIDKKAAGQARYLEVIKQVDTAVDKLEHSGCILNCKLKSLMVAAAAFGMSQYAPIDEWTAGIFLVSGVRTQEERKQRRTMHRRLAIFEF